MKRKNYPLLTVAGAAILTAAPLLPFCFSAGDQNSDVEFPHPSLADSAPTDRQTPAVIESQAAAPAAIVASVGPSDEMPVSAPAQPLPAIAAERFEKLSEVHPEHVPVSPDAIAAIERTIDSETEHVESTVELLEVPRRPDVKDDYYQATGHLAMVTQMQVSELRVSEAKVEPQILTRDAADDRKSTASENKRTSRSRRSNDESPEEADNASVPFGEKPGAAKTAVLPGAKPAALIEDVIIQTPLETAAVGRVENVVAMTRAKGWPVALVRSDLPDDVWWVQQMVGIQGNSFAARVNFGNEYSLNGSAYRMVVVFLDSPDEVRRFRIAKQFKEIPEGVRRSREFRYIRN